MSGYLSIDSSTPLLINVEITPVALFPLASIERVGNPLPDSYLYPLRLRETECQPWGAADLKACLFCILPSPIRLLSPSTAFITDDQMGPRFAHFNLGLQATNHIVTP